MIELHNRFREIAGSADAGGETTSFFFHFVDYDERRKLQVFGSLPANEFDDQLYSEPKILEAVKVYAPRFTKDTRKLHIGPDYNIDGEDGSPLEDFVDLPSTTYALLEECPPALVALKQIKRRELVEMERISIQVDVCYYRISETERHKVVFKYYIIRQAQEMVWGELDICSRLPPHPYIAPFDRLVLEGEDKRLVGFTTVYIPGGNLEHHPRDKIKLKWLQQMIQVIDDLNLKHGIQHCDVHPRNFLIDATEDKVQLIDFGFAVRFREDMNQRPPRHDKIRSDTWGVAYTCYEIITRDYSLRDKAWEYPDVDDLMNNRNWQPHSDVSLDHDVELFRDTLQTWLSARKARGPVTDYHDCPENLGAPLKMPDPPKYPVKRLKKSEWKEVDGVWGWHREEDEGEDFIAPIGSRSSRSSGILS